MRSNTLTRVSNNPGAVHGPRQILPMRKFPPLPPVRVDALKESRGLCSASHAG